MALDLWLSDPQSTTAGTPLQHRSRQRNKKMRAWRKKTTKQEAHDEQRAQNINNVGSDSYLSKRIKTYNAILTTNGLTFTAEP